MLLFKWLVNLGRLGQRDDSVNQSDSIFSTLPIKPIFSLGIMIDWGLIWSLHEIGHSCSMARQKSRKLKSFFIPILEKDSKTNLGSNTLLT